MNIIKNNCPYPTFNFSFTGKPKNICQDIKENKLPGLKAQYLEAVKQYKSDLWDYFICKLQKELNPDELKKIKRAFDISYSHVEQCCQFRKVGKNEPYPIHPVEVALIVANEMGLDSIAIISALLHDILEDCGDYFTYEDIKKEFGEPVALTVDGVTKMTKLGGTSKYGKLENFRKMILSISKEYRVILIKMADRLHNMRTMEGMPPEKQKLKSAENLYVYSHFARAVGMYDVKNEMEDLSFRYLYPQKYQELVRLDETLEPYRKEYFSILKEELYKILNPLGYDIDIITVKRSLYELWQKLKENDNLNFKDIHNRESLRIVVNVDDKEIKNAAFRIFAQIVTNNTLDFIGSSLKNYINTPKPNGFKALIFDVIYPYPKLVGIIPQKAELQILSKHGHIVAQKGANFRAFQNMFSKQKNDESVLEFIQRSLKLLNTDLIYVYTPKMDIIELPKGASVLDFAFKIHTNLGLHCIAAKINYEKTKPPFYKLKSGEIVEVLTAENVSPQREWLKYVVTPKARNYITRHLKISDNNTGTTENIQSKTKTSPRSGNLPITINDYNEYEFAECCNPTPDSDAVAFIDQNGKTIIHRSNCPVLSAIASEDNLVPVVWNIHETYYKINLIATDRIGLLNDISSIISKELKIDIREIHMKINDLEKTVDGLIIIKVVHKGEKCKSNQCSPQDVKMLMNKIKAVPGMIEVKLDIEKNI